MYDGQSTTNLDFALAIFSVIMSILIVSYWWCFVLILDLQNSSCCSLFPLVFNKNLKSIMHAFILAFEPL